MDLNESVMVVIESFGSALKDKNIAIEVSLKGTSPIISADGDGGEFIKFRSGLNSEFK